MLLIFVSSREEGKKKKERGFSWAGICWCGARARSEKFLGPRNFYGIERAMEVAERGEDETTRSSQGSASHALLCFAPPPLPRRSEQPRRDSPLHPLPRRSEQPRLVRLQRLPPPPSFRASPSSGRWTNPLLLPGFHPNYCTSGLPTYSSPSPRVHPSATTPSSQIPFLSLSPRRRR